MQAQWRKCSYRAALSAGRSRTCRILPPEFPNNMQMWSVVDRQHQSVGERILCLDWRPLSANRTDVLPNNADNPAVRECECDAAATSREGPKTCVDFQLVSLKIVSHVRSPESPLLPLSIAARAGTRRTKSAVAEMSGVGAFTLGGCYWYSLLLATSCGHYRSLACTVRIGITQHVISKMYPIYTILFYVRWWRARSCSNPLLRPVRALLLLRGVPRFVRHE